MDYSSQQLKYAMKKGQIGTLEDVPNKLTTDRGDFAVEDAESEPVLKKYDLTNCLYCVAKCCFYSCCNILFL